MIELLGKSLEELQSIFKTHNIQKFRAKQLIDYIYHRYVFDFQEMCFDGATLWLFRMCFISSRLCYGLCILCLYTRWLISRFNSG